MEVANSCYWGVFFLRKHLCAARHLALGLEACAGRLVMDAVVCLHFLFSRQIVLIDVLNLLDQVKNAIFDVRMC